MSYDGKAVIGIGPLREQVLRDMAEALTAVNGPDRLRKFYRSDGQPIKTNLAMKYPLLSRRERRQMAREGRA